MCRTPVVLGPVLCHFLFLPYPRSILLLCSASPLPHYRAWLSYLWKKQKKKNTRGPDQLPRIPPTDRNFCFFDGLPLIHDVSALLSINWVSWVSAFTGNKVLFAEVLNQIWDKVEVVCLCSSTSFGWVVHLKCWPCEQLLLLKHSRMCEACTWPLTDRWREPMHWNASRCANMHGFAVADGIKMCCLAGQLQRGKLWSRCQCQKRYQEFYEVLQLWLRLDK